MTESGLARFGLLGEGAAPVFTAGARYPLAGLLLALPALERARQNPHRRRLAALAGLLWIDNQLPFRLTTRPNPTARRQMPTAILPSA